METNNHQSIIALINKLQEDLNNAISMLKQIEIEDEDDVNSNYSIESARQNNLPRSLYDLQKLSGEKLKKALVNLKEKGDLKFGSKRSWVEIFGERIEDLDIVDEIMSSMYPLYRSPGKLYLAVRELRTKVYELSNHYYKTKPLPKNIVELKKLRGYKLKEALIDLTQRGKIKFGSQRSWVDVFGKRLTTLEEVDELMLLLDSSYKSPGERHLAVRQLREIVKGVSKKKTAVQDNCLDRCNKDLEKVSTEVTEKILPDINQFDVKTKRRIDTEVQKGAITPRILESKSYDNKEQKTGENIYTNIFIEDNYSLQEWLNHEFKRFFRSWSIGPSKAIIVNEEDDTYLGYIKYDILVLPFIVRFIRMTPSGSKYRIFFLSFMTSGEFSSDTYDYEGSKEKLIENQIWY